MTILGADPFKRRQRKPQQVSPEAVPSDMPITLLTAIQAQGFEGEEQAKDWLEDLRGDRDARDEWLANALALMNRALHAQRAAAGDPYIHELSAERALAARGGYGSGEQLADGRFAEAIDVGPAARRRSGRRQRTEHIEPQARLAAVLGGREGIEVCETLILRARTDMDAGRTREAALQLRVGLEALLAELQNALNDPGHGEDMAVIESRREEIGKAANAALVDELDETDAQNVEELLELCERVLRRRRLLRG